MAKLTPAQMKKAVEEFKKKFTTGFYHGSPSPDIKEFDPTKSKKDPMYTTPKATFVTRDPEFAESFLSMNNSGKIKSGSTMYPVSVDLGQHWNPNTPEGQAVIAEFIAAYPKRVNLEKGLKRGDWTAVENSDFIKHLQDTGHSTFHVMEGGVPNVGVFEPQKIRGKFAEYNPEEAANPDFMKAAGGAVGGLDHLAGGGIPKKVVKAYKLFKTKGGNTDELYPLFVNANKPVPLNEWVNAEVGPVAASGKVKSKLGELAYRPGWHAGDLPVATHIGGKSAPDLKAPDFRRPDEVWAEVEMPDDVSWQEIANQRARLNKAGKPIASTAHITDQIPEGGFYRYKTSPNMEGNWLIGGGMKVNRVLTDEEVMAINEAAGVADLPRFTKFDEKAEGGAVEGYAPGGKVVKKFLEHARQVPFVHYSKAPNISTLDPNMYGTGIKGAEASRLKSAPDIRPRTYIYTKAGGRQPEQGLGPHKYEGVAEDVYPLHDDPMGFSAIAKERALDPYMMQFGREVVDEATHLNELERLIKKAGYKGYANDDVGLLFDPTPVIKSE
jgi:hypothetical protein